MQTSRNEDEELRGRFTIWLEKTLLRKRNKYLARMQAPYLCHSFRNLKSVKLISVLRTKIYALPIINCILSIESSWLCFTCISWNPQKSLSWDTVKARTSSIASNIGSFRSFGQRFLHMKATEQDNGAFSVILSAAISGNNDALVQLILMYRPLIDGLSVTDGGINEDLRQELLIHLIKKIKTFSI